MDFDRIVKEWFYRLPKGYADAPYTAEELSVLDEVMTEFGITLNEVDELDQGFLDAEPVEEDNTLYEAGDEDEDEILLSRKELADILLNGEFSDKALKRIQSLIVRDSNLEVELQEFLSNKVPKSEQQHIESVIEILLSPGTDQKKLTAYVNNTSQQVPWETFLNKPTGLDVFQNATGVSKKSLARMATFVQKGVGPFEWLLAVLLKNGSRPFGKGDLTVDGKAMEVKAFNGRLRAPNGMGGADTVRETFIAEYERIANNQTDLPMIPSIQVGSGVTKAAEGEESLEVITDPSAWSSGKFFTTLDTMNQRIIELADDDVTALDVITNAIQAGLHAHNIKDKGKEYKWIRDSIKPDGTIDRKQFLTNWAIESFYYYLRSADETDPVEWFVVVNSGSGSQERSFSNIKILIFNVKDFPKLLGSQIGIVPPDFGPGAGQGNAFAVKFGSRTAILQ
jgi:hypothetical protein